VLAKHWNISVVTLEPLPWNDLNTIQKYADEMGVGNKVLAMNTLAQKMPFGDNSFDAVISIGSFEIIKDERPQALQDMIRVAKKGSRIGIAEPMCRQ
jgi:ubiquinone/menaquinone biosynthesis C-methylase UbiE